MYKVKYILPGVMSIAMLTLASCKKDYKNPNAATDVEVFANPDALARVIVGIKQRYAVSASVEYFAVTASALTTKEAVVLNAGNADLANIETGASALAPNNGLITNLWSISNLINNETQKIINGAAALGDLNLKNSVLAYGHLYKALALGTMASFWEKVPIQNGTNAVFSTRIEALQEAVRLLDAATTLMNTTTIPASFTTAVGNDIDLKNSLLAIAARYYNMLGDNDKAIARAAAVDLTKRSAFFYNNTNPNPVFRLSLTQNNVYGIRPNCGLSGVLTPNAADKRLVFHLTRNGVGGSGFFLGDATSIPLYQPGEMLLIQAEANARKTQLPQAKIFLDQVLTKTPAADLYGVGADLPAYAGPMTQQDILDEIYKNRCIEMYLGGLKFEDSRRFNRPAPGTPNAERSRNYYPYPQQERDGNPVNCPPDPSI